MQKGGKKMRTLKVSNSPVAPEKVDSLSSQYFEISSIIRCLNIYNHVYIDFFFYYALKWMSENVTIVFQSETF